MRNGSTRLLLWTALGAVIGLLAVLFVGEGPNATIPLQDYPSVTVPASAAAPTVSARAQADDPSSETDVERVVADGANEITVANVGATEGQSIAPTGTRNDPFAARTGPSDRPAATPSRGTNDAAPLSWCFRARSGFTWQDEPSGWGPRHGLSSDASFVWQGSASARLSAVSVQVRPIASA